MKLREKLADWLTKGDYGFYEATSRLSAQAAQGMRKQEERDVAEIKRLEAALMTAQIAMERNTIQINKLATENHRMSEGLDAIIRAGEGKIEGRNCNGSLRRVVRMAEAALYPDQRQSEMAISVTTELSADGQRRLNDAVLKAVQRHKGIPR